MTFSLIRPAFYKTTLAELLKFVKAPHDTTGSVRSVRDNLRDTIGLFVIKLVLFVMIAVLMAAISRFFDPENISLDNMTERFPPAMLFLVAGLALPLLEEVGFRLSLKFKPIYLAMSASVICYYFLTKVVFGTSNSVIDDSFALRAFTSIGVGLVLLPCLRLASVSKPLACFWVRKFRWIFYFSCASFAFVHLFNYELTPVNILLMPLITMPQIVSAVIYGYARVTLGFQYALLIHVINNVIFVLLSMLPDGDLFT